MQSVKTFCFLFLLILCFPLLLFAQEDLVLDKIFFQDEVIRKVSVGDAGIWVIKGLDSMGVGKLEADDRELDYTQTVNSAVPLTGIVGKYGDSAMIATKGNYLLLYDKGNITRLDGKNGVMGHIIHDIYGSPNYTRIATDWAARESYDNQQFSVVANNAFTRFGPKVIKMGKMEDFPVMACISLSGQCFSSDESVFNLVIDTPGTFYQTYSQVKGEYSLNALATNHKSRSTDLKLFLGNKEGLRVRHWECRSKETLLLQDTTVFSISRFEDLMLVGTEKGLFTCPSQSAKETVKINLNDDYEVYDIAIHKEENTIWLATNKGLVRLQKKNISNPKTCEIENLEWSKNIGSQFPDKSFSSLADKQGNIFITGFFQGVVNFGDSTLTAQNQKDFFIAKYDPSGKLVWVRSAINSGSGGKRMDEEGEFLALDNKGNVYLTLKLYNTYNGDESWEIDFGTGIKIQNSTGSRNHIVKYDPHGTALWVNQLPYFSHYDGFQMDTDSKDNLYLSMRLGTNNPYNLAAGRGIMKFNPEFELVWAKHFSDNLDYFKLKKSGEFYLSGLTNGAITIDDIEITPPTRQELLVVFLDQNARPKWWKSFGGYTHNSHIRHIKSIGYDLQGNTFIAGDFAESLDFGHGEIQPEPDNLYGVFLAKINAIGEFEWVQTGNAGNPDVKSLEVDSLGATYLNLNYTNTLKMGNRTFQAGERNSETYIAKFEPEGSLSWAYSIPGLNIDNKGIARDHKNNIYVSGTLTENIYLNGELLKANGWANIFLAKITDTSSPLNRNLVRGKAYYDKNNNHVFDEGDEPIKDNIIKAEPGSVYARTDDDGNYFLYLKEGNYSIDQIIPQFKGRRITQTFPAQPYQLSLSETRADTTGFDFAHDVAVAPYLSVDVSSDRFRRCFTNHTVVEYCNEGFATAENVQLVLEYPDYVIPIASNVPWSSKSGKTLTFNIGTLQPQQCKSITLTDSVMCGDESIRGLMQCIRAYVTPANISEPDPSWDQSDIELSAECKDNGFVRLTFQNTGSGDMADSAAFRIFLQESLAYSGKYKLQKAEILSLNVLANGRPLHLQAELSPFHPRHKTASISIQGCDEDGNTLVEHTFTNQFAQKDDQEEYEISCLEIIDSYDPNDKQVIPAGISAQHYVAEGSLLEYTIRFQNTGTDTAYTVVISDLLDKNLDIGTLQMGLSSHPVKWELSGEEQANIIWRFHQINLPDSTTNEKASHGFVKFKIRPKEEAGFGTVIRNQAAIYFDYNSPIITNEVLNTLGLPESPAEERALVQKCDRPVNLVQEEDMTVILCENDQLNLSRQAPAPGSGMWKLIKGQATIEDKYSHHTQVENLAYGENIFQWEVNYCDLLVRSTIKVIREKLPARPQINPLPELCQDDPLPVLMAHGQNIEWYADPALTQLLGSGNTFQPELLEPATIFVIQQNEHCKSEPAIIELKVRPKPVPPVAASVEICEELQNSIILKAEGENIRWYADQELESLLGEGAEYQVKERIPHHYYATQSSDYCESDPATVVVSTKAFDHSKAFFANVITPNGDEWNQQFYVDRFDTEECLGEFKAFRIYNRLGKIVFESQHRDFNWDGAKVIPGIYFFSMEYELRKFNGTVQVLE